MADAPACAHCGKPVPPRGKPGGVPKRYCSRTCQSRHSANATRYSRARGCPNCPHCQARLAADGLPEWVTQAIAEVRGWVRVSQALADFRQALHREAA